jgi:two-component system NtrC family sensor kinase
MPELPVVPSDKISSRRASKKNAARVLWAQALAHELRNPLNAMAMNLKLVHDALAREGRTDLGELITATRQEIDSMAAILELFLTYARPPKPHPQPSDLNQLITAVVAFLKVEYENAGIAIHFHPDTKLPPVMMDTHLIRSVIINTLGNSRRALADHGGTITVASGLREGMACLTLENDGPPIPVNILGRLFQPFVSGFGGTGLGLAIARRIVREHYGTISAHNRQDGGPIFTVCLPLAKA